MLNELYFDLIYLHSTTHKQLSLPFHLLEHCFQGTNRNNTNETKSRGVLLISVLTSISTAAQFAVAGIHKASV